MQVMLDLAHLIAAATAQNSKLGDSVTFRPPVYSATLFHRAPPHEGR